MVMSDKRLPAMPDRHALAARREAEIAERLDEMRGALRAQAMQERRILRHVCAVTGKRFSAVLRRESPDGEFRIFAIEKEAAHEQAGRCAGWFKRTAPAREAYASTEIDLTGWCCPWCSAQNFVIECSRCKESVCMGRARLKFGKDWFFCHSGCGDSFRVGDADEVRGERGAMGSPDTPALPAPPGGDRLRLPKK
jgi:hypothetical protein